MTTCECRVFKNQGWCQHVNPEKKTAFSYIDRRDLHALPERDREYEQQFLTYVESLAVHLGAPADAAFTRLVNHRTDGIGPDRYGDIAFLVDDRDLPMEAAEEAGDVGVYAMFEAEKFKDEPGDECYHHLAQAAAFSAVALYHLRQVQRIRST